MNTINSLQNIGDIAAMVPKASEIFKEYNIDFCCGGNRTLLKAIKEQNLDERELLNKLNSAFEEAKEYKKDQVNFTELPPEKLVNYIESKHHVYLKGALPQLSELTTKILRVHGANHNVLFRVHKLFHNLKTELEQHLIKEEEILFPMIREYAKNPGRELLENISKQIRETENEHDAAGDIIKELRNITQHYKVPRDGCNTYSLTFQRFEELEADLFQHIHLENNILFKKYGNQKEADKNIAFM